MANFQGAFHGICHAEFDLGSPCIQRIVVDGFNVLLLSLFFLILVLESIRRNHTNQNMRKDWIFLACSVCCALNSIAHFSASLWDILDKSSSTQFSWLVYLVRGLIWISVSVSLIIHKTKITEVLSLIWWVSSALLASALNLEVVVRTHTIPILDIVSWPLNIYLLFCALRLYKHSVSGKFSEQNLSEPLLTKKSNENQSNLGNSDFFSHLTFSWLNPLLRSGYLKPLVLEDIPSLVSEDEAFIAYQSFSSAWDPLRGNKNSSQSGNLVIRALAKVHLKEMIVTGIYAFLRTISVVVSPLVLYAFVEYSSLDDVNLSYGLLLVGCLVVVKIVESLSQRHWFFNARRSGMRMRSALMVAVYQKQLKLSSLGRKRHSTGEIVNYIAVDAYRMGECPFWFHSTWTYAAQLFLAIGVLIGVVGLGALPGLIPLFICGIANIPFARFLQNCQSQFMAAQDERLRATSEVLNNMKVIKLHSWEEKFKNLIESLRDNEFKWLSKSQLMKTYGTALYWMSPTLVSSVVFIGCVVTGSAPLNASTIFTILATLRSMAEPVRMIPEALSMMIQVKVSLNRLGNFLLDDELKEENVRKESLPTSGISVRISSGVFCWSKDMTSPTVKAIDLEVRRGQKIAVCGPVGAGKSSLLYAILGEISKIAGHIEVFGSIAYVSQTAWIQSGTLRDNILYGKPMDNTKYEKAIKACALDKDIDSFSHGDLTEIGQRGINMSGGQKQRIQLARAVYNDADIYLLDDPFSAVDAHTASTLFNNCVMGALEKKTVILVTHQVEFLAEVDRILVMEGGQVTQSGSYQDLLSSGTAFEQLVNAHKNSITVLDPTRKGQWGEPQKENADQLMESNKSYPTKETSEGEISVKGITGVQLTEAEEKEIGDVGWKPFFDYLTVSKGLLFLSLSTITQSGFVALQVGSTYWLAIANQIPQVNNGTLIGVYAGISACSAIFVYLRSYFATLLGLKASKAFFSSFTNSVFRAPMLFFDSTPIGRIFTRASSDLCVLDFDIPFSAAYLISATIETLATIAIMASVTWPVLIVGILAMIAVKYVQEYYLASAREIVRINGTTKAPVMNYAAETSLGVATIRAFSMMTRFFHNYLKLIDIDATLFFHSNASMEWLLIRVEALQNLTLFTAAFLLVLLPQGTIAPGFVGLSLSYALSLTATQVFMTRWYCNLSNYIISVERIKQFMHIPPEPPAIVDDKRPPYSWPSQGRIDLKDLKIKYRPNAPLVLKGISCTFKEGTRVGVVGRTGSGKTTLISALFRLVEPDSGRILIDGLDICSMGLRDLRLKLSIIPQEPTLFRGTVRTNLDPLGLYSDQQIWDAIEKCQLKATIRSLPNLLDSSVSDEGDNWSVGQRQLFCLGRVLLKRNKILVLDEATASIDSATDAILQRVIRKEFANCTVITVAHRVPTVIDSDMVMVLSYGKLLEYDEPSKLMGTNSSFSKLVAEYWSSCRRSSMQNLEI
ncbi:hypothetical protein AQUCO_02000341v1 [Aquilegia coerulea]|uniref:ABC transporter C family member 8 n=1 Tax=Aquilegia coerulea TaxID=218851 RepID=A0A2G5DH45_AQUCA|nr:hypothetical protein AQUCO_02000341v1 [Aquilegia coerulea]